MPRLILSFIIGNYNLKLIQILLLRQLLELYKSCKGVLSTLACGIALCSAVLGTLHHGITPWGRRHQKGYLLVPWYHYGTTTAALYKPSGSVPVPWAQWFRLN